MTKVLVLGAAGMLGQELMKVFGNTAIGWDRGDADVLEFEDLKSKIEKLNPRPGVVINCAAYNNVDSAEDNAQAAMALNAVFPGKLASLCKELNIVFVHFSSNYVFDGEKGEYNESDLPNPKSVYGSSKYAGERLLQNNTDKFYLIRTAALFGFKGESGLAKKSFVDLMLELSEKGGKIKVVNDEINSITSASDLAKAVHSIIAQKKPFGIYHITNSGQASWYGFAKEIFAIKSKNIEVVPVSLLEFPRKAQRPKKAVLINSKLPPLRAWQKALSEYLNQEV